MVDASDLLDLNRQLNLYQDTAILTYNDKPNDIKMQEQFYFNNIPSQLATLDVSQSKKEQSNQLALKQVKFMAVYGIIKLKEATYIILVTKSSIIGQIVQRKILRADKFEFVALKGNGKILGPDNQYILMLQNLFKTKTLYYSEDYDLTQSLQRQLTQSLDPVPQYFVNQHLLVKFQRVQADAYAPVFISGLVSIKHPKVANVDYDLVLISRRDKRRMGRRFISRGADLDGNCSNFAETEQIVSYLSNDTYIHFSFIQTRGSIPFKWRQKPNLKWSPKGQILGTEEQNQEICRKHFLNSDFQKQVLVNLIDKKGTQKMLGEYYQKMIDLIRMPNLKYIWFDFHFECKNMKYENIGKLINLFKGELDTYSQFQAKQTKGNPQQIGVLSRQTGVIRTNCVDCLDRTNVVQSAIARQMIWRILLSQGIPKQGTGTFEKFPDQLEQSFRDMWTQNADYMSILYTGTGAMKTDFTRTGKRTSKGALQDGKIALMRYVIGNFYDADTQNSIDLLTGQLSPAKQQFKPAVFNPFFALLLLFTCLPIITYYGTQSAPGLTNIIGAIDPDGSASHIYKVKFGLLTFGITFIGMFILSKLVVSSSSKFVKQPLINH